MQGEAWDFEEIGFPELTVHPRYLVDDEDEVLLDLWGYFKSGGLGSGPLPAVGGIMDQPACVLASFDIIAAAEAALKKQRGEGSPKDGRGGK